MAARGTRYSGAKEVARREAAALKQEARAERRAARRLGSARTVCYDLRFVPAFDG
jgi:hypothetical protein